MVVGCCCSLVVLLAAAAVAVVVGGGLDRGEGGGGPFFFHARARVASSTGIENEGKEGYGGYCSVVDVTSFPSRADFRNQGFL